MTLAERILATGAEIDEIADWLDHLDPGARIEQTRALDPAAQRRLWRLTRGRAVALDDIVPPDRSALEPVRHYGRNTLPAFTLFEKRFCRPLAITEDDVLWGYNEGRTRPVVGPGYFICRATDGDSRGEAVVDYTRVPPSKPAEWPTVRPNEWGLQRFVYAGMLDFLRRVSEHVTIGRAYRRDRETNNFFVLCREE